MGRELYVYMLTNASRSTFYTGVTNDLQRRMTEHKDGLIEGFTKKYRVNQLVYFEVFDDPELAIAREKRLKRWNRNWKIELIEKQNSEWRDLSAEWFPVT